MSNRNFLEEKFIQLNELKSMLISYPKDYSHNIIEAMERVCNLISSYLEGDKKKYRQNEKIQKEFTAEELAKYNGKDGMPAYIAVDGKVYDLYDIRQWNNGVHFGISCGQDQTEVFGNCHKNSNEILSKLRQVGTLK